LSKVKDNNALVLKEGDDVLVKQAIMLYGGVMTSLASLPNVFQSLNYTNYKYDASPSEAESYDMHAVFCYGWWNNPSQSGDGWWLCKNRCVHFSVYCS
jgi:hypothetical protein